MFWRRSLVVATAVCLWPASYSCAQIYRWDNGNLLPYTNKIRLEPGVKLDGWKTNDRNLQFGDFPGDLTGATFTESWLDDARFVDANLSFAQLNQSSLRRANFERANLTGANLAFGQLAGANLTGAVVNGANLNATGVTFSQIQSTFSYQSKNLRQIVLGTSFAFNGADFRGQNLSQGEFYRCDLRNANFSGADLTNTSFLLDYLEGAIFSGAVVTGAKFFGNENRGITLKQLQSTASYQAKDLRGIWLTDQQWMGNSDFQGQNLANARFDNSRMARTLFTRANLEAASLDNTTLNGADFSGANLTGAILYRATLAYANLSGATVTGARFAATTSQGFLAEQLYSTASYQTKDLRGIDLSLNDLSGWDFSGQNLMNANLGFSSLANVNLSGADLRGVEWSLAGDQNLANAANAILPDGSVQGLTVESQQSLAVRDDDGNPSRGPRLPLPVTIERQLSVSAGGTLRVEFESDPWDSVFRFWPGIPVQLGGTLELKFTDDTKLATQVGRTIKVFDWTGVNPLGTFTVASQPGTAWDTSKLHTTGEVTLLGISTDLNGDRDVDTDDLLRILENWTGSDYLAADKSWQDGDSDADGDVDSADMQAFLSQWTGAVAADGARVAGVPEPSFPSMASIGIVTIIAGLRRRWR